MKRRERDTRKKISTDTKKEKTDMLRSKWAISRGDIEKKKLEENKERPGESTTEKSTRSA